MLRLLFRQAAFNFLLDLDLLAVGGDEAVVAFRRIFNLVIGHELHKSLVVEALLELVVVRKLCIEEA